MRDIAMELRGLAAEEGATPVVASKVADAVAMRAGKRRLVKRSAVGAGSALAVGGIAVAGLLEVVRGDLAPPATSPAGPETLVVVNYVPEDVENLFFSMDPMPSCGEPRDFSARSEHGLTLTLEQWPNAGKPDYIRFDVGITNQGSEHLTFIANRAAVVLVQDGVMVNDPSAQLGLLNSHNIAPGGHDTTSGNFIPEYHRTCAGVAELDELANSHPRSGNGLTGDRANAFDDAFWDIVEQPLKPGEYTAYAWTPVMFGESAAAARAWSEAGFSSLRDLGGPQWEESPLHGDDSLSQYCSTVFVVPATGELITVDGSDNRTFGPTVDGDPSDFDGMHCDVPSDVLAEQLQRMVPESYINDYEMTYIVSEPITFTVE